MDESLLNQENYCGPSGTWYGLNQSKIGFSQQRSGCKQQDEREWCKQDWADWVRWNDEMRIQSAKTPADSRSHTIQGPYMTSLVLISCWSQSFDSGGFGIVWRVPEFPPAIWQGKSLIFRDTQRSYQFQRSFFNILTDYIPKNTLW